MSILNLLTQVKDALYIKNRCIVLVLICFLISAGSLLSRTKLVPSECATIHDAVISIMDPENTDLNNEIIISPRTQPYDGNVVITGFQRNLIIRSTFNENAPDYSIISNTVVKAPEVTSVPSGIHPVFYITNCGNSELGTGVTIKGLSITGGYGQVLVSNDPDNSVEGHQDFTGGGVCIDNNYKVKIEYCKIYDNKASHGGGVYSFRTDTTIQNSEIFNNGLYYYAEVPISIDHENHDGPKGAGVFFWGGNVNVTECKIYNNKSYIPPDDVLYTLNYQSNLSTYGNYAAFYFRHYCGGSSLNLTRNQIYNNITRIDPALVEICAWHVVANAFIQRADIELNQPNPSYVSIQNNTVYKNKIILTETNSIKSAVAISRYHHEYNTGSTQMLDTTLHTSIVNNIIYNNTEGNSSDNQSTVSLRQLYGFYFFIINFPVPVVVKYCDINDVFNPVYYSQTECIDENPLFVNQTLDDYKLSWTPMGKSPCIDSGPGTSLNVLYDRKDIGALEFNEFPHYTFNYTLPRRTTNHGIKWMSFPVLYAVDNGEFTNHIAAGEFFLPENILDPDILEQIEWNDINNMENNDNYIHYVNFQWTGLTHEITSKQGYKVQMDNMNDVERTIEVSGFLQDVNTQVQLFGLHNGQYKENWLGYYYPGKKHVFDAFNEFIDELWYIQTQNWTLIRQYSQLGGPWVGVLTPASKPLILLPGDMVVVKCFRDFTYTWSDYGPEREPLPPLKPEHFEYLEKFEYIPILTDFRNSNLELPKEIAVYINGVCKGASVVTDSLAQILAYICDDIPDNPELEFMLYYDNKSMGVIPEYDVWNPQTNLFQNEKLVVSKKQNYFLVNITKANVSETQLPRLNLTNYPNPFNPITNIRYYVPDEDRVKIGIYNSKGQLVRVLVDKRKAAGMQEAIWDGTGDNGKSCSSGIYYCKLNFREKNISKKLVLMK